MCACVDQLIDGPPRSIDLSIDGARPRAYLFARPRRSLYNMLDRSMGLWTAAIDRSIYRARA